MFSYGSRFVWHEAEEAEIKEGTLAGLAEAGFVPIEEVEAVGMIGQSFEGHGLTRRLIEAAEFGVEAGVLALHFEVEGSGFNGPEAALTPLGDDDFFNEIGFDAIARLEAKEIGIEGLLETLLGFIGEEDGLGGEAVGNGIGGGDLASFKSLGPQLRAPLARETTHLAGSRRRAGDQRYAAFGW